jgi:hypothetical protein
MIKEVNHNSRDFSAGFQLAANLQKSFILKVVESWCSQKVESAAIAYGDVMQGQVKNADALYKYLREYLNNESE